MAFEKLRTIVITAIPKLLLVALSGTLLSELFGAPAANRL
jgi:hypothetical protein